MRHDYDLPPDWAAMTDEEKSRWMTQDRARRQALSQQTPHREHARKTAEREARKRSAHPGTALIRR